MSFKNIALLNVHYLRDSERLLMGRLAIKERKIFFEYNTEFLATNIQLSPFKLPLQTGLVVCKDPVFAGLFGVFNDSLPDGWGRLLLDRKLMKLGVNYHELSPLDRLHYVGQHGMGALVYTPAIDSNIVANIEDLDEIAYETMLFQETSDDKFVDELLAMNGSSAGARPKIMLHYAAQDWIIKFRSALDPKDIGPVEYAYHLMAVAAKLDVPEARIFPAKNGPGYFGVKRFDRVDGKRIHMHTLSGLLHADHRIPNLDYETILKATLWLTKDVRECEKQFRIAVFNVLSHNRDDHSKNFAFLLQGHGNWLVSPAYDLTFSAGPVGEHCTMIMGEGKKPTFGHFLKLAEVGGIKKANANQIIEEVQLAVSKWSTFAKQAGTTKSSYNMIQSALTNVAKDFI